jgi:cytochrome c5
MAAGGFLSSAQNDNQGTKQESKHIKKLNRTTRTDNSEEDGQQVYEEHCSRCHNAPEGFSPRIAGTITRHMRVRANLTQDEERAVLKFFNP